MSNLPLNYPQGRCFARKVIGRILAIAGIYASLLTAQAQEPGRLQGRIQDAVDGSYMSNAEITVTETGQSVNTESDGTFRLVGVSPGTYNLQVQYFGYYDTAVSVSVVSGDLTLVETVQMKSRNAFEEGSDEVFELESFQVRSNADAMSRALNRQRYADYSVNVVDSGQFGNVAEGNVGEFAKSLPGVNINYVDDDARSINVRGMADNFTSVTVNGNKMASASSGGKSRDFELEQVSMANVERVEVVKVPTADLSADAIGGSVNLISKSAFERDGREIKYKFYLSGNSESLSLHSTPGPDNGRTGKVRPNYDFSYAESFMDNSFGVILNYSKTDRYNPQSRFRSRWVRDTGGEGAGTPILRRIQIFDGPKFTEKETFSIKADYKLSEKTIIGAGLQYNEYEAAFRNRSFTYDTNVTSTTDSDANDDGFITPEEIRTDTGRGDIDLDGSYRNKFGDTWHGDLSLKHYGDVWTYEAGLYSSSSTNFYTDFANGMVMNVISDDDYLGQFSFSDLGPTSGAINYTPTITLLDRNGNVDPTYGVSSLATFDLDEVQTRDQQSRDELLGFNFDMKRNIRVGDSQGYVKMGVRQQTQDRRSDRNRTRLVHTSSTYDDTGIPFEAVYSGQDTVYLGSLSVERPDYGEIYSYFAANPGNFEWGSRTAENALEEATQVFDAEETITAAYLMGQLKFLDSRLGVTAGVRYEKTEAEGNGAEYIPGGGDGIADPIEAARANWGPASRSNSYDYFHPSVNFKYDINENMALRLAYANTIGRPDFDTIIPLIDIDEEDAQVELSSVFLSPQISDKIDLTLEYYSNQGGSFSASVFQNKIENFIGSLSGVVDSAALARYRIPNFLNGYTFITRDNVGDATVQGIELSVSQSLKLDSFPKWLHPVSVMANATLQDPELRRTSGVVEGELEQLIDELYNFSFTYDKDPWKVQLKWNYTGEQQDEVAGDLGPFGDTPGMFIYRDTLEQVDIDFEFDVSKKVTLYVSGRNIFNHAKDQFVSTESRELKLPERTAEYGVGWVVGVKGRF